jgi:hypothetical protein
VTLATVDPDVCPECSNRLETMYVSEPAIVRHGGYGATRRTSVRYCVVCPYSRHAETSEVRP